MDKRNEYCPPTAFWEVLAIYDKIKVKSPEEKAGWEKASEFACFYLSALELLDRAMPSPGFRINEFGKRLLNSKEAKAEFKAAFDTPLIDDKDKQLRRAKSVSLRGKSSKRSRPRRRPTKQS